MGIGMASEHISSIQYIGMFEDNSFTGIGLLHSPNYRVYVGYQMNNYYSGEGVMFT